MLNKLKTKLEMNFIQMLLARIQSKSPAFYITLRKISGVIMLLAGAVLGVLKMHIVTLSPELTANLLSVCEKVGPLMTGIWGASFTGTADQTLITQAKDNA